MRKERLVTFSDAVIAIALTVLVLDLPQPQKPTIGSILALTQNYIAFLISFFGIIMLWSQLLKTFQAVRKIDNKILIINGLILLLISVFPYATKFVATFYHSLVAEWLYGIVFITMSSSLLFMNYLLIRADPANKKLRHIVIHKRLVIVNYTVLAVGFLISFAYEPSMLFSSLISMTLWVIPNEWID
ncbi:TMEM175 family protein [Lactobacillaceae bacterium Scapto_B20]